MRRNLALRIILERNLNRELLAIWRAACPPDAVITRLDVLGRQVGDTPLAVLDR